MWKVQTFKGILIFLVQIVRSYTSTSKSLTDQLSGEIKDIESDLYQRLKQSDAGICKLKLDFESMYNSKMEDKKVKNDIIDKQVKYLSRQVKILLFHVKKNAKWIMLILFVTPGQGRIQDFRLRRK